MKAFIDLGNITLRQYEIMAVLCEESILQGQVYFSICVLLTRGDPRIIKFGKDQVGRDKAYSTIVKRLGA